MLHDIKHLCNGKEYVLDSYMDVAVSCRFLSNISKHTFFLHWNGIPPLSSRTSLSWCDNGGYALNSGGMSGNN